MEGSYPASIATVQHTCHTPESSSEDGVDFTQHHLRGSCKVPRHTCVCYTVIHALIHGTSTQLTPSRAVASPTAGVHVVFRYISCTLDRLDTQRAHLLQSSRLDPSRQCSPSSAACTHLLRIGRVQAVQRLAATVCAPCACGIPHKYRGPRRARCSLGQGNEHKAVVQRPA